MTLEWLPTNADFIDRPKFYWELVDELGVCLAHVLPFADDDIELRVYNHTPLSYAASTFSRSYHATVDEAKAVGITKARFNQAEGK